MKSKRAVLTIMMVIPAFCLYLCVGVVGFPGAPLLCGPAVVRVAFWCGGAVEPSPVTSWPPVRLCGPPGLANFDFRALFLGTLKEFVPSWEYLVRACFLGQGWSLPSPVPGCGLFVGARRGGLS